ncbi:type II toxin-antitoxin system RelE/ParE family toxin [Inquilinus sp. Marseille-Q2685]
MKVEWRPAAQADRDAIYDYIEADNPRAALVVDTRACGRMHRP